MLKKQCTNPKQFHNLSKIYDMKMEILEWVIEYTRHYVIYIRGYNNHLYKEHTIKNKIGYFNWRIHN